MPELTIVVIGASAGGVGSLVSLVSALPASLPAALFVVLHLPENSASVLPAILQREARVAVRHARDGEALEARTVYIAPPGFHLLVKRGHLRVVRGPQENGHRPAVDPLFRSAAAAYGPSVIGVVLSGALDDGTAGLLAIKTRGGIALVQDPNEALFAGMPTSAIEHVEVDTIGTVDRLAAEIVRIAERAASVAGAPAVTRDERREETDIVEFDRGIPHIEEWPPASPFTCPQCHGTLFDASEGGLMRYRCHTGHAYSQDTLGSSQAESIDTALWIALRALQENEALLRRLQASAIERGHTRTAERFRLRAAEVEQRSALIRTALARGEPREESA